MLLKSVKCITILGVKYILKDSGGFHKLPIGKNNVSDEKWASQFCANWEALNRQYEEVFSKPDEDMKVNDPKDFFKDTNNNHNIRDVHFTYQDVRDAIDQLSAKAAAGPDGIPAIFLKSVETA